MLGMQDQVAVHQLRALRRRLATGDHPQEVRGMRQRHVGQRHGPAIADRLMRRHDHRHLRGEADALVARCLHGIVVGVGLEAGERRDGGAQHVHRVRLLHRLDEREDLPGQPAGRLQLGVEGGKLGCCRQFTIEQQVGRLLEARLLGKVVDRIAAVAQLPGLAVDEGGAGALEIDALQATVDFDLFFC